MSDTVHPHQPLRALAPGLFVAEGHFGRSPMGRRMSVIAGDTGLFVHAPMRLRDEEQARLDALGPVRWILPPNRMHVSEAPWYAERYPDAVLLAPSIERERYEGLGLRLGGSVDEAWPAELKGLLDCYPIHGLKIGETALHHVPSRTLIVNDLCFNFRTEATGGFLRLLMRINGVLDRLGPSRLLKWVFLRDHAALARSLEPVLALEIDRVVVSHGSVLESGGGEALRRAFGFLKPT
jgi:hypothetical protein